MPWAVSFPEAAHALLEDAPGAALVYVGHDDRAYGRLVERLWGDVSFILVEQDIVVRPGTIAGLAACPEPYCGFPYHEAAGWPVIGLGCTKFDARLFVVRLWPAGETPVWQNLDASLGPRIREVFGEPHRHEPWLRHLNPRVLAGGGLLG